MSSPEAVQSTPSFSSNNPPQITNAEFIAEVFPQLPEGASVAVCSKAGDPTEGGWSARPSSSTTLQTTNNNYVSCSSFCPSDDGTFSVRKTQFKACHFLLLDDLGTKVPLDRLGGFELSFLIETSPGNCQGGIILSEPITEGDVADRLHKAIIIAGLCDEGASGPLSRWARLPNGINGKAKYKGASDTPFTCRLLQWSPEKRYTPQDIVDGLHLELMASKTVSEIQREEGEVLTPNVVRSKVATTNLGNFLTSGEVTTETIVKIQRLINCIDPDCGYQDWTNVLMAIHYETGGSNEGLVLADEWSRGGSKYKGISEIKVKWDSFVANTGSTFTIGTLIHMVKETGADWQDVVVEPFEVIEDTTSKPIAEIPKESKSEGTFLDKFSLKGMSAQLEKDAVDQVSVLGGIALQGQMTAIYAEPSTGKTLITLKLLIDAIEQKSIIPSKTYYLNMDDNSQGLLQKVRIAEEFGFHMLVEGYNNFKSKAFFDYIKELITRDQTRNVILILDTLKKFVDLMDKSRCREFSTVLREFVSKGGTLIALAHTNKSRSQAGKLIPGGTSDIRDDFDCAYVIDTIDNNSGEKAVMFENIKRRGDVVDKVAYCYSHDRDLSYTERLLSVRLIEEEKIASIKQAVQLQTDQEVIAVVLSCIREEINSKMKLAVAVSDRAVISRKAALKIIEKYTGDDQMSHRWNFKMGARGRQEYSLLAQKAEELYS